MDSAMQTHDTLFTPTEAAVLTGLPLKAVNNAIDRKTVSAVAGEEGGRLLDAQALVSLSIERRLSERLATPELRRKVFDALAKAPRDVVSLEGGLLKIDLREPRRELAASCAICAGPGAWPSAIPRSSAAIRCSAARGCPCIWSPSLSRRAAPPAELMRRLSAAHGRDDPAGAGLCGRLPAARPAAQAALARSAAGAPGSPAARRHCGAVRFLIDECLSVGLVAVAEHAAMKPGTSRI